MSRSVPVRIALAAFLCTATPALVPAPLAAQQPGSMEKDSVKMGKKDIMDKMDHGKMKGDSAKAMQPSMMFMGAAGLKAGGDYEVTKSGGQQKLLLTDHFSVTPAPDLYLVLSTGPAPGEGSLFLGRLKQPEGSQSYELPGGRDLTKYTTLLVWSKKEKRAVATAEWHPSSGAMEHERM